jgi:hypothetical protein
MHGYNMAGIARECYLRRPLCDRRAALWRRTSLRSGAVRAATARKDRRFIVRLLGVDSR